MSVTISQFALCDLFISQNVTCTYHKEKTKKRKHKRKIKKKLVKLHTKKERKNSMDIIENDENTRKL